MRRIIIVLSVLLFAACNGDADTPQPASQPTPQFYINPNALPAQLGEWILLPETVSYAEEVTSLAYGGTYQYGDAAAQVSMTVYRTAAEAQAVIAEQLAAWRGSSANTVTEIDALGNESYVLNNIEAGLSRVQGDGVLLITTSGERTYNDLEFLALMQVGVNILSERQPAANSGSMGSATLAPIPTEEG